MSDDLDVPPEVSPDQVARLDPTSIRALAHPLRVRMLGLLRTEGPATATTLAQRLGKNTGATSYHLRQLAAHGFIVEDTSRGAGRERWWRSAHVVTYFDRSTLGSDESGEAFLRAIAQIYAERIHLVVDQYATLPAEWREANTLSDWNFRLTSDEARQLKAELFEVMNRYRLHDPDDTRSAPADAVRFSVQLQAYPDARDLTTPEPDGAGS